MVLPGYCQRLDQSTSLWHIASGTPFAGPSFDEPLVDPWPSFDAPALQGNL
jgi:hypothetical protein